MTNQDTINFSIVICTYNRALLLESILKSLLGICSLIYDMVEIIVVDNNSSDATKDVVEVFVKQQKPSFNIRYVFEPNQGLSFARNSGIKCSTGDIIIFIDDDVQIKEDWLVEIKKGFEKYPGALGMGGVIIPIFDCDLPAWLGKNDEWKNLPGIVIAHNLGNEYAYYNDTSFGKFPFGANMAFKKTAFEKYGFFNINLGRSKKLTSHEDAEFCQRLVDNKEKLFYNPHAIVWHPVPRCRLTLSYIMKWFWYAGISKANILDIKNCKKIFNIPLYEIRGFIRGIKRAFVELAKFNGVKCALWLFHCLSYLSYFYCRLFGKNVDAVGE